MSIQIKAPSGGGSVSLDTPANVVGDFTLTTPAAAGTIDRLERDANVLQIVHFQNSNATVLSQAFTSSPANVFQDTELTAQIAPIGTNSHVFIITNQQAQNNTGNGGIIFRVMRNTSAIGTFTSTGYLAHFNSTGNMLSTDTMVDVDNAGNLSGTLTYKTQFKVSSGGTAFTRGHTMTLVEVAR